MEIATFKSQLDRIIFKEPKPFVLKKEINWRAITKVGCAMVGILVVLLLLMPTPEPEQKDFQEKADPGTTATKSSSGDALEALQAQVAAISRNGVSFDYLNQGSSVGLSRWHERERNGPMIISRGGYDAKNQLPPGTRLAVKLLQKAVVANQGMPVIGIVSKDIVHEDYVAVPQGAKIFGEMSFDDSSDRAQVSWKTLQFPDGRERQLSGIGVSMDGQVGVEGKVHSDGFKNTAGQILTRFISAYAEGSMQKGAFGASQGGSENGLKNAVAETAKDRGEAWAEDLKKQKRWIEVGMDSEFLAVINQPFTFRDPGTTNGQ